MTPRTLTRLAVPVLAAGAVVFTWLPGRSISGAILIPSATNVSSPIILFGNDQVFACVNPDNDTVSIDPVALPNGSKAHEYAVGKNPESVAVSSLQTKLYVANAGDGTVSVLSTANGQIGATIPVGAGPYAVALVPNGNKAYVANTWSNSVSVIDTATDKVTKTIFRVGARPRTLAVTDTKVYVTWWLAQDGPDGPKPGSDTGKVGKVTVISTATDEIIKTFNLQPIVTGFKADGDSLNKIAPTGAATVDTSAFPNVLGWMAIKGDRIFVPAIGSSPNGPVKFNVNVQALLAQVDTNADADAGKTANLNRGVQFEAEAVDSLGRPLKRFFTNPTAVAMLHNSDAGLLASGAADQIVRFAIGSDGTPTIGAPTAAGQPDNIKRVLVGSNPRGIVISQDDSRAYVFNYVSRDMSIVDVQANAVVSRIVLANQPSDFEAQTVQRGKELFNTGIGPLFTTGGVVQGAMSDHGWVSCASCHPDGLTDGVTWMFPSGPRVSTPLNAVFAKGGGNQRALNWSAIFDEPADFELNTRGVAGGHGLIVNQDGTPDTNVKAFDPPSAGRSADRDAITEYLRFGIRTPASPIPANDLRAGEGRRIFRAAGCTNCHGGPNFTSSHLEFLPPPPASALVTEQGTAQLVNQLKQVGTFNAADPFELIGTGANISKQALGSLGFNPPSLRGIHAFAPYLHNGTATTLNDVLDNPAHVGTSPLLSVPTKRAQLIRFLNSIDDGTAPVAGRAERDAEDRER